MSGANVPYQLRTNKFVERQLFLDLLDFVRVWNGPARYVYASMGGRFLADFKLINDRFGIEKMISIESDEVTWGRQKFNRPHGFIECRRQASRDFILEFENLVDSCPGMKFIVWLDYAAANERGVQLQEYQQQIAKLGSGDVLKITLNANPQSACRRAEFGTEREFSEAAIGRYEEQLGEYLPEGGVVESHLNPARFAELLAGAVRMAALKGMEGSEGRVIPLASCRYRDGEHQMLTVTVIVADLEMAARIEHDDVFTNWEFRSPSWEDVHEVNVPDLSPRERHFINSLNSEEGRQEIHQNLPFWLDRKEEKSIALLENYLRHYRRYPSFGRVEY